MYRFPARRSVKAGLAVVSVALIAAGAAVASGTSSSSGKGAAHMVAVMPSSSPGVATSALSATPIPDWTPIPTVLVAPAQTPKPLLAKGAEASRDQIPWDQVGSGWTVALYSPKIQTDEYGNTSPVGQQILYVLNPLGGRYRITSVAEGVHLAGWSSDSKHVSVGTYVPDATLDIDLVSGTWRPTPAAVKPPHPASAARVGAISKEYSLASPDEGRRVFAATHGLALVTSDGGLVRAFDAPHGYAGVAKPPERRSAVPVSCAPVRWWSPGVVEMTCGRTGDSFQNVWAVPLDGGPMTQLTTGRWDGDQQASEVPYGVNEVWQTDFGRFALPVTDCGAPELKTLSNSGMSGKFTVPTPVGMKGLGRLTPVSVQRRAIVFQTVACGQFANSLFLDDLATHQSTVLLGPGINGGSVNQALPNAADL